MTKRATKPKANTCSTNSEIQLPKLRSISPITRNQKLAFEAFEQGKELFLTGWAGTGKTLVALYLALRELEKPNSKYDKVVIVRSAVEVRAIGALPGSAEEKLDPFEQPYFPIFEELYGSSKEYTKKKQEGKVQFLPTSFIRGTTIRNAIVVADEASNDDYHELSSIITRLGNNCRIIFAGDFKQSDLKKDSDRKGYLQFQDVLERMKSFQIVEFQKEDIVRGPLVKEFLLAEG